MNPDVKVALSQMYMLARLSYNTPTANPRLADSERQLAEDAGAEQGAVSAQARKIYDKCPTIKRAIKIVRGAVVNYRQITSAWNPSGTTRQRSLERLLRADKVVDFLRHVTSARRELAEVLATLDDATYQAELATAQTSVGSLANQINWLTLDELKARFWVLPAITPIADATMFPNDASIPTQVADYMVKQQQARERVLVTSAFADRRERLTDALTRYRAELDPDRKVYASVRQKCLDAADDELAQLAERLDKTDITEGLAKIRTVLAPEAAQISNSETLRQQVREGVDELLEMITDW